MSRIGKLPITIPKDIQLILSKDNFKVTGINGTFNQIIPKELSIKRIKDQIIIEKEEKTTKSSQKHGLFRSLIKNIIFGTNKKFEKKLKMFGVGYRATLNKKELIIRAGYSHTTSFIIPDDIEIIIEENINLTILGSNKEKVGQFAAKIRNIRPPEPYNGKGICYANEIILRKVGKSGKK